VLARSEIQHAGWSVSRGLAWLARASAQNPGLVTSLNDPAGGQDAKLNFRLSGQDFEALRAACQKAGLPIRVYMSRALYHFCETKTIWVVKIEGRYALAVSPCKHEVLEISYPAAPSARIVSRRREPMFPDDICRQLSTFAHRASAYSYLFRIYKQGLLLRRQVAGRVAYELSRRGRERLHFFNHKKAPGMIRAAKTSRI
jgi:hypothetical protein